MKNLFRARCLVATGCSTRLAIRKSTWKFIKRSPTLNAQNAESGLTRHKSLNIITLTIKVRVICESDSCFSYYSCGLYTHKYYKKLNSWRGLYNSHILNKFVNLIVPTNRFYFSILLSILRSFAANGTIGGSILLRTMPFLVPIKESK